MVVHQAVCIDRAYGWQRPTCIVKALNKVSKQAYEPDVVLIIFEYTLTVYSPKHHMIDAVPLCSRECLGIMFSSFKFSLTAQNYK